MNAEKRDVILSSDDCRVVRYKPSDGKGWLWDVEVMWEESGAVLTIGCTDGAHARRLFGQLNNAAHITYEPGSRLQS
jgi:hypothetical protein